MIVLQCSIDRSSFLYLISYLKNKSSLDALLSVWDMFYEHYHPFQDFLDDCDKILTNVDPNVTDVDQIQDALDETKVTISSARF